MKCPKCNSEVVSGSAFCPSCGSNLTNSSTPVDGIFGNRSPQDSPQPPLPPAPPVTPAVPATEIPTTIITSSTTLDAPTSAVPELPQETILDKPKKTGSKTTIIMISVIVGLLAIGLLSALGVWAFNASKKKTTTNTTQGPALDSGATTSTKKTTDFKNVDEAYEYAKTFIKFKNYGLAEATAFFDDDNGKKLYSFTFVDKDSYVKEATSGTYKNKVIYMDLSGSISITDSTTYVYSDEAKPFVADLKPAQGFQKTLEAGKIELVKKGYALGNIYYMQLNDETIASKKDYWKIIYVKKGVTTTGSEYKTLDGYGVMLDEPDLSVSYIGEAKLSI